MTSRKRITMLCLVGLVVGTHAATLTIEGRVVAVADGDTVTLLDADRRQHKIRMDGIDAPDPETFREDARFALDALPALTARTDQIKQLRQSVLSLAVNGRLVQQSSEDGSALTVPQSVLETLGWPGSP